MLSSLRAGQHHYSEPQTSLDWQEKEGHTNSIYFSAFLLVFWHWGRLQGFLSSLTWWPDTGWLSLYKWKYIYLHSAALHADIPGLVLEGITWNSFSKKCDSLEKSRTRLYSVSVLSPYSVYSYYFLSWLPICLFCVDPSQKVQHLI